MPKRSRDLKYRVPLKSIPRSYGITRAFRASTLSRLLQDFMGHRDPRHTSRYTRTASRRFEGLRFYSMAVQPTVGSAVVFVMAGVAVISRSLALAGRAPRFETASALLIMATGLFLLWRTARPHVHSHTGDGKMLAFVTGLVPCPLTTFILTYAIAKNQLAVGFAAVGAMTIGVIATIASFAVAAVFARERLVALLARTEWLQLKLGRGFELASACAVIVLGIAMLNR